MTGYLDAMRRHEKEEAENDGLDDPKPARRIRDPKALRDFHASEPGCVGCGHGRQIQAHHILSRARGGDDIAANLVGLCPGCHGALHGAPYRVFGVRITEGHVEQAIGRYIASEAGDDTRWYLTGRLGVEGSVVFLERLGVSG